MYADYDFYRDEYMGSATRAEFARFAPRAGAEVRRLIFGRDPGRTPDSVRMAECAVLDELIRYESHGSVLSEANDGISVTYAADGRSLSRRVAEAADVYLDGTGLNVMAV